MGYIWFFKLSREIIFLKFEYVVLEVVGSEVCLIDEVRIGYENCDICKI